MVCHSDIKVSDQDGPQLENEERARDEEDEGPCTMQLASSECNVQCGECLVWSMSYKIGSVRNRLKDEEAGWDEEEEGGCSCIEAASEAE